SLSRRGLFRTLGRLDRRGRGILAAIEEGLRAGADDLLQQDALARIRETIRPAVERAREHAAERFLRREALVLAANGGVVRLEPDFRTGPEDRMSTRLN